MSTSIAITIATKIPIALGLNSCHRLHMIKALMKHAIMKSRKPACFFKYMRRSDEQNEQNRVWFMILLCRKTKKYESQFFDIPPKSNGRHNLGKRGADNFIERRR